jgi:predicted transcriptional regulator of viral defense system
MGVDGRDGTQVGRVVKLDLFAQPDLIVFTTREYAAAAGIGIDSASRQLARLKRQNKSLQQLTRGVWANTAHPHFNPYSCVAKLAGREQAYVSFLSALHLHGVLSQIPATIQIATTGHTRALRTPIGTFEFLQLKPALFRKGIDWRDTAIPYLLATVEKALFDTLYISTRKKRRFSRLPELELDTGNFNERIYKKLIKNSQLPPQVMVAMRARYESLPLRL